MLLALCPILILSYRQSYVYGQLLIEVLLIDQLPIVKIYSVLIKI